MNLQIKRFVNDLMASNSYCILDNETKHAIIVDPGSEKSSQEIEYIENNDFIVDYIILTHEHTDHTWGVNSLIRRFSHAKVVCSNACKIELPNASSAYFRYYYDDSNYTYSVLRVDYTIDILNGVLKWGNNEITFYLTPGHSKGSMCFRIDNNLFTGDTVMPYPPFFNGRGSCKDLWKCSIMFLINSCSRDCIIYPGHGELLSFSDWIKLNKELL